MATLQLRYRQNGIHFIPQFKYVSSETEGNKKEPEWKDFEFEKHVEADSIVGRIAYHLACIQHNTKLRWNEGWYFKRGKKDPVDYKQTVYFLHRTLVCTFLGAIQGQHGPESYHPFNLDLSPETPA